jgi:hypothetical protein
MTFYETFTNDPHDFRTVTPRPSWPIPLDVTSITGFHFLHGYNLLDNLHDPPS